MRVRVRVRIGFKNFGAGAGAGAVCFQKLEYDSQFWCEILFVGRTFLIFYFFIRLNIQANF